MSKRKTGCEGETARGGKCNDQVDWKPVIYLGWKK